MAKVYAPVAMSYPGNKNDHNIVIPNKKVDTFLKIKHQFNN